MLAMAIVLVVGILAVVPWTLTHYVHRLPYAPECPHCRAVTAQAPAHGPVDRVCALLAATPVRHCARCGWTGRMRWRLAHERVRDRR
ncbi:MAG TPA: hypothetical protein VF771_07965 [Longimicrobiaceae bacterium]